MVAREVWAVAADTDTARQPATAVPGAGTAGVLRIAGAHGGAGTTMLARWLAPAQDLGTVPVLLTRGPDGTSRVLLSRAVLAAVTAGPLILAARGTTWSAGQAATAARAIAGAGGQIAVIAVTGDGLPEPGEARYRYRALAGVSGAQVFRIPYLLAARSAADPAGVRLPRRAAAVLDDIAALAGVRAS